MPKQIIAYVNHKKNAWIVWTADFSGSHPDVLMREYPLTLTRTGSRREVQAGFRALRTRNSGVSVSLWHAPPGATPPRSRATSEELPLLRFGLRSDTIRFSHTG